jgi:arsenical pump membrane protein
MTLIIGNPTNVYLASSYGVGFFEYLSVMWLPALAGGLTGLIMIFLLFRKQLLAPLPTREENGAQENLIRRKTPLAAALIHLSACIILLAFSDFISVPMWLICLILALSLTTFDLAYDLIVEGTAMPVWRSIKKEPYELIPFVLSMFVIVLALKDCGFTELLSNLLLSGKKADGVSFGLLSAGTANLLNNIPMSVLFEQIVASKSLPALYGSVIGSNIGAFITPVGALAGIMWNKILAQYGVKLPFVKFVMYGATVAIPTLLASVFSLMLVL